MISLRRTVAPTVEPVSLDEAKDQCRVQGDADSALLVRYIQAAREYAETRLNRAILQQTIRLSRSSFPGHHGMGHALGMSGFVGNIFDLCLGRTRPLLLPRPPLIDVLSVTYLDATGTRQTLDPSQYLKATDAEPGSITPAPGCYWPATLWNHAEAVQVTYTAGYGATQGAVPASVQLAILGLVAHWYENRESVVLTASPNASTIVPQFVDSLLLENEAPTVFDYEA